MPESPPPGTGNLSLEDFSRRYELDTAMLLATLKAQGLEARADMTLKTIAAANKRSPVEIYDLLRSIAAASPAG